MYIYTHIDLGLHTGFYWLLLHLHFLKISLRKVRILIAKRKRKSKLSLGVHLSVLFDRHLKLLLSAFLTMTDGTLEL